jgi:hypothetical protein
MSTAFYAATVSVSAAPFGVSLNLNRVDFSDLWTIIDYTTTVIGNAAISIEHVHSMN